MKKESEGEKQRKVVIKWLSEVFEPFIRVLYYYVIFWQKVKSWLKCYREETKQKEVT